MRRTHFQAFTLALALVTGTGISATIVAQEQPATAKQDFADLVQKLDHDDFKVRQEAATKLKEAGVAAIPALIEAAQSSKLEVMSQSLMILRQHYEGNQAEIKAAAKSALEKLSTSSNSNTAQRAKDIVAPAKSSSEENQQDPNNIVIRNGGGQIIIGNGIQGRIQILPGNMPLPINGNAKVFSKSVSESNGVKTTKVKEDGTEIEIKESKEEIIVKKTENGKTEEFKAKDAEELKKNHPTGHDLYEKHVKDIGFGGAIQIQAGGAPVVPGMRINPVLPGNVKERIRDSQLQSIDRQLESIERTLDRLADSQEAKDALKPALTKLKEMKEELQKGKEKLQSDGDEKKADKPKAAQNDVNKEVEAARQAAEAAKAEALKAIEAAKQELQKEVQQAIEIEKLK
jgi:hypothetical protein